MWGTWQSWRFASRRLVALRWRHPRFVLRHQVPSHRATATTLTKKYRAGGKPAVAVRKKSLWETVCLFSCGKTDLIKHRVQCLPGGATNQAAKFGAQSELVCGCRSLLRRLTTEVEISKAIGGFPTVRLPIEVTATMCPFELLFAMAAKARARSMYNRLCGFTQSSVCICVCRCSLIVCYFIHLRQPKTGVLINQNSCAVAKDRKYFLPLLVSIRLKEQHPGESKVCNTSYTTERYHPRN